MSTVSAAVITGGIVAGANLVDNKGLQARQLIGVGLYVVALSILNEINSDFASKLAVLVLVGVAMTQTPRILSSVGF
jgi:hypothetical protein